MSMMHSDLETLTPNAVQINASKAIESYSYLSKTIAEEKKRALQKKRKNYLFCLLLISIAVLLWDQPIFTKQPVNLEAFHPAPALGELLSGDLVEYPQAENTLPVHPMPTAMPDAIVKLIDADATMDKRHAKPAQIVLEEVTPITEHSINIDKILASGHRFFKRDRLMSPPEHNAFRYYEKVLSVEPNHPQALQGIKNIVGRYVFLAESVIAKNEDYKVAGLIKNAYHAGEKYMDVSPLLQRFSKYLPNDALFTDTFSTDEKGHDQYDHDNIIHAQREETIDDFHSHVALSADKKIASAAYDLYRDGDVISAEKMLNQFIPLSGFWGDSNNLLLKIYLREGKFAEAEQLIHSSKTLGVYQFAEKAARIMVTRGDIHGALDMLIAHSPELAKHKAYYLLLAGLYNNVGDFTQAAYWYRQLLSLDHEDARLWLGLAVSLDALNHVDDALKAFEYVRLYAKSTSAVKHYIDEKQLTLIN